jgi:SHAQKYF class myb-like DNA-binding protein
VGKDPKLMDVVHGGYDRVVVVPPNKSAAAPPTLLLPNLTSAESLVAWNRIHSSNPPSDVHGGGGGGLAAASRVVRDGGRETTNDEGVGGATEEHNGGDGDGGKCMEDGGAIAGGGRRDDGDNGEAATATATASPAAPTPPTPTTAAVGGGSSATTTALHHTTNSNFWLREEEDRFLQGLNLYGWGNWKRIQAVVRTRTNKQIKSHAQKRERTNPDVRDKYARGVVRRGRISSRALAEEATEAAAGVDAAEALANGGIGDDDVVARGGGGGDAGVAGVEIPSLDRARMDVYGTTGDDGDRPPGGGGGRGENSRSRSRYRRQAADVLEHRHRQRQRPNQQQQQQQGLVGDQCVNSSPAMPPLPPHNWHIAEAASQPRPRQQQHRISLHSIDHSRSPHHFRCMPTVHRPPPPHGEPAYSSTAIPVPGTTECAQLLTSIVHAAGMPADAANAMHAASPPPATLRPGMRVFSRRGGLDVKSWYPGHVYSARVDPNNMAHAAAGRRGGGVPLIYHVRFDDGTEDPHVPEADVSCGAYYDELYRQRSRAGGEWASRSAEEVYNSFLRKEPLRHQPWGEERGAAGKHDTNRRCDGRQEQGRTAGQLDLLFTASQIATPGEGATNMREATARDDCYDVYNRTRVEGEQQMMALV